MFHDSETTLKLNEKKERELRLKNEAIDRQIEELLSKEALSKISTFTNDKAHFSDEEWETLQEEKAKLDQLLKREVDNIVSPQDKANKQKERNIPPTWLFVR